MNNFAKLQYLKRKQTKNQINRLQKVLKKIHHCVHFCEKRVNQTRSKSWFNYFLKKTMEIVWDKNK